MQNRIKVVLIGTSESKRKFMEKMDKELGLDDVQPQQLKPIIGIDFLVRLYNDTEFHIWDMIEKRFNHLYSESYVQDADGIIFTSPEYDKEKLLENNSKVMKSNTLLLDYNPDESPLDYLNNIEKNKYQVTITPKRSSFTFDDYNPQDAKTISKKDEQSSAQITVKAAAQQDSVDNDTRVYSNAFLFSHVDSLSKKNKQEKEIDEIFSPATNCKKAGR